MQLYLIRHAQAEAGEDDAARPLSKRGRRADPADGTLPAKERRAGGDDALEETGPLFERVEREQSAVGVARQTAVGVKSRARSGIGFTPRPWLMFTMMTGCIRSE